MLKKRLDYIAIPNSHGRWKREREKKAVEEFKKRYVDRIIILKGRDSEEDILYLGKVVEKGDRIGIDTFPLHFEEYKEIIKKAKKEGKFPRGVKVENIKISQDFKTSIYGVLGLWEERLNHGKLDYLKNRHDKFWEKIKSIVKRIIG